MGCGCKKRVDADGITYEVKEKITLFNIIKKFIIIALFLLISPIILILIWVIGINSIVGSNLDIINVMINAISKKNKNQEIVDEEDYNIEDLELVDVEVVKK